MSHGDTAGVTFFLAIAFLHLFFYQLQWQGEVQVQTPPLQGLLVEGVEVMAGEEEGQPGSSSAVTLTALSPSQENLVSHLVCYSALSPREGVGYSLI